MIEVKFQLDYFYNEVYGILSDCKTAFDLFNDELYRAWASPNAVDFNEQLYDFVVAYHNTSALVDNILDSASKAASYMARSNGTEFSYSWHSIAPFDTLDYIKLVEKNNGRTGMNIPLCKIVLADFIDVVTKVVYDLNNIKMNFSLFDPAGDLQAEYRKMLKAASDQIASKLTDTANVMDKAFEEETMQITMGKEQAAQELAG